MDTNDERTHAMSSSPGRYIKPVYANPLSIPFADDQSGNHLGIDLDPDAEGSEGQVIMFGRDENCKRLVAQSFEDFIEMFVAQLGAGNFVIREKILGFKTYLDGEPLPARAAPARCVRVRKCMSGCGEARNYSFWRR